MFIRIIGETKLGISVLRCTLGKVALYYGAPSVFPANDDHLYHLMFVDQTSSSTIIPDHLDNVLKIRHLPFTQQLSSIIAITFMFSTNK